MSDPVTFESTSPRFALPLLFAGQAQKEMFVNEALGLLDGLVHCAIEGTAAAPPVTPVEGSAWIVGDTPTGEWAGKAGQIALRQAGQWLYAAPQEGTRLLNKSSGQDWRYLGGAWRTPAAPANPTGGTTVDIEARATVSAIIAALRQAGVFPA